MAGNIELFYKPNNHLTIKVECRSVEDIFKELGPIQEVFNEKCGKCGCDNIRPLARRTADDKHDVYELVCTKCGAKLSIGKSLDGNLFPRRYEQELDESTKKWVPKTDKDGKRAYLPDNGWVRWDSKAGKNV